MLHNRTPPNLRLCLETLKGSAVVVSLPKLIKLKIISTVKFTTWLTEKLNFFHRIPFPKCKWTLLCFGTDVHTVTINFKTTSSCQEPPTSNKTVTSHHARRQCNAMLENAVAKMLSKYSQHRMKELQTVFERRTFQIAERLVLHLDLPVYSGKAIPVIYTTVFTTNNQDIPGQLLWGSTAQLLYSTTVYTKKQYKYAFSLTVEGLKSRTKCRTTVDTAVQFLCNVYNALA